MDRLVEGRHGRGQVILGKDVTCPISEHRGWGTGCETILLKQDGRYHCAECGLVYDKPGRCESLELGTPTLECECVLLNEVIVWWFDECHGYNCPCRRYLCAACGRHYVTPRMAGVELQESEAAKMNAADYLRFEQEELAKKRARIERRAAELAEDLKKLPPEERLEIGLLLFL